MNIIVEGNPYLRKLAINLLTSSQITRSSKYVKYQDKKGNISKSMLLEEINKLRAMASNIKSIIDEESGEQVELSLDNLKNEEIVKNLSGNFYTIYFERMESQNVYIVKNPLLLNNNNNDFTTKNEREKALLLNNNNNDCKIIERTYKSLSSEDYIKHFSSLYDIISKENKNSNNKIEKSDEVSIRNFVIDKSPFSLCADDINYEKFDVAQLQDLKEIEDLFEKEKQEEILVIDPSKENENIIYDTDVYKQITTTNYGLSPKWFNDLFYLRVDSNGNLYQIDYKKSNISPSDLQEIANSIINNDIIFINLTNIQEDEYNRYSTISEAPFTFEEQRRISNRKIPGNKIKEILSQMGANDILYNSLGIKNYFKYKKPSARRKKNNDENLSQKLDEYSEKFNDEKMYKKYYEINIPFFEKDTAFEEISTKKDTRIDQIKDTLYKELEKIINLEK